MEPQQEEEICACTFVAFNCLCTHAVGAAFVLHARSEDVCTGCHACSNTVGALPSSLTQVDDAKCMLLCTCNSTLGHISPPPLRPHLQECFCELAPCSTWCQGLPSADDDKPVPPTCMYGVQETCQVQEASAQQLLRSAHTAGRSCS
jgi:hypothetical protein